MSLIVRSPIDRSGIEVEDVVREEVDVRRVSDKEELVEGALEDDDEVVGNGDKDEILPGLRVDWDDEEEEEVEEEEEEE
jgi:hypothetical protein